MNTMNITVEVLFCTNGNASITFAFGDVPHWQRKEAYRVSRAALRRAYQGCCEITSGCGFGTSVRIEDLLPEHRVIGEAVEREIERLHALPLRPTQQEAADMIALVMRNNQP